jgi:hypothetical protein
MPNIREHILNKLQRNYLDLEIPKILDSPMRWAETTLFDRTSKRKN